MTPFFDSMDVIAPSDAFDGPMQMALDEAMLAGVTRPTLRIYSWSASWVTFGYFQKRAMVESLHPRIPSVRRWSGGGVVMHGEDLTFSLAIPKGNPGAGLSPAEFYRSLHGALSAWVASLHGAVQLAGKGDVRPGEACFSSPAPDDLMAGGTKVLGGAIRRSSGALLYQGSLRIPPGAGSPMPGPGHFLADSWHSVSLGEEIVEMARCLVRSRYGTEDWNCLR